MEYIRNFFSDSFEALPGYLGNFGDDAIVSLLCLVFFWSFPLILVFYSNREEWSWWWVGLVGSIFTLIVCFLIAGYQAIEYAHEQERIRSARQEWWEKNESLAKARFEKTQWELQEIKLKHSWGHYTHTGRWMNRNPRKSARQLVYTTTSGFLQATYLGFRKNNASYMTVSDESGEKLGNYKMTNLEWNSPNISLKRKREFVKKIRDWARKYCGNPRKTPLKFLICLALTGDQIVDIYTDGKEIITFLVNEPYEIDYKYRYDGIINVGDVIHFWFPTYHIDKVKEIPKSLQGNYVISHLQKAGEVNSLAIHRHTGAVYLRLSGHKFYKLAIHPKAFHNGATVVLPDTLKEKRIMPIPPIIRPFKKYSVFVPTTKEEFDTLYKLQQFEVSKRVTKQLLQENRELREEYNRLLENHKKLKASKRNSRGGNSGDSWRPGRRGNGGSGNGGSVDIDIGGSVDIGDGYAEWDTPAGRVRIDVPSEP